MGSFFLIYILDASRYPDCIADVLEYSLTLSGKTICIKQGAKWYEMLIIFLLVEQI